VYYFDLRLQTILEPFFFFFFWLVKVDLENDDIEGVLIDSF
jgi:hypothetical protein